MPASPPSTAECEELWARGKVPDDPFTTHEAFVARCARSEREILTCVDRVIDDSSRSMDSALRSIPAGVDAGTDAEVRAAKKAILPFFLRTRLPICMARERLRFALRTGELDALAHEVVAGKYAPDGDGEIILQGSYATLPSRGTIEHDRTLEMAPDGEARLRRMPDGRVWLYFLGGLFGRHQNQMGFLYSSAPFEPADFRSYEGAEHLCLGHGVDEERPPRPQRYLLSCFSVSERLSPQLLVLESAPD